MVYLSDGLGKLHDDGTWEFDIVRTAMHPSVMVTRPTLGAELLHRIPERPYSLLRYM